MSERSSYELPSEVTRTSSNHTDRIRPIVQSFRTAIRPDRSVPAAAYRAIRAVTTAERSPAILREAAALLLRETARMGTNLGPVAVALAIGAIEGTPASSRSAETNGRAAIHGLLTAALEIGPYAEVVVSETLRCAAAVPVGLTSQARHDVRSIRLR